MRVLLISANREELNMKVLPLGPALVAQAAQRAGHGVRLLDLMGCPEPAAALSRAMAEFAPQVVGVSVRNVDDQNMAAPRLLLEQARQAIDLCRSLTDAPLVVGGAGYSIFPRTALDYLGADMGIEGEGEQAFPLLLAALAKGEDPSSTPGLHLPGGRRAAPRAFAPRLDGWPLAGLEQWLGSAAGQGEVWAPVQSRRGCPLGCGYCSTPLVEGRRIRRRSPAQTASAMAAMADAGIKRFYFTDNVFNLPPSHARDLCRALAQAGLGIEWRCILYPGALEEGLVADMARAGCVEAALGFESGAGPVLRTMGKRYDLAQARRARRLLGEHGIRCQGFLLLGGPGETRDTVRVSLDFAEELAPEAMKLTVGIRIYPGTRLAALARARGLISPGDDLLRPRFYLEPGLDEGWLRGEAEAQRRGRPNWFF